MSTLDRGTLNKTELTFFTGGTGAISSSKFTQAIEPSLKFAATSSTTNIATLTAQDGTTHGIINLTSDIGTGCVDIQGLCATPETNTSATSKAYVDSLVVSGVTWKNSCRLATTAVLTGTYAADEITGAQTTVDGIVIATGDRILVKDYVTAGTTSDANGIYVVGSPTTTWARSADASSATTANGSAVFIYSGDDQPPYNNDTAWVVTNDAAINFGGDVTFSIMATAPSAAGDAAGQVQYNDGTNRLAASADFVFTDAGNILTVGADAGSGTVSVGTSDLVISNDGTNGTVTNNSTGSLTVSNTAGLLQMTGSTSATVTASSGAATVTATGGNAVLTSTDAAANVTGATSSTVTASAGAATLTATGGNAVVTSTDAAATVTGATSATMTASAGAATVTATGGNAILTSTDAAANVTGATSATVTASSGAATLTATGGNAIVTSTDAAVTITGATTASLIATAGDATINGNTNVVLEASNTAIFNFSDSTMTYKNAGTTAFNYNLTVPSVAGDIDFVFPVDEGSSNYVLSTDGSGNTSWTNIGSVSSLPQFEFLIGDVSDLPSASGTDFRYLTGGTTAVFNVSFDAKTASTMNFGTSDTVGTTFNVGASGVDSTVTVGSDASLINLAAGGFTVSNSGGDATFSSTGGSGNTLVTSSSGNTTVSSTLGSGSVNLTSGSTGDVVITSNAGNTFTFSDTTVTSGADATYTATTSTFTSTGGDTTISTTGSSSNVNLISDDTGLVSMTQGTTEMFNFENDTLTFKNAGTNNINYSIVTPAVSTTNNLSITLPPDAGTAGYVLRTDGAGVTTWVDPEGALALPQYELFVGDVSGQPVPSGDVLEFVSSGTTFSFNIGTDASTTLPTVNVGTGASVTTATLNVGSAGVSSVLTLGSDATMTNAPGGVFTIDNSGGNTVVSSTSTGGDVLLTADTSGGVVTVTSGGSAANYSFSGTTLTSSAAGVVTTTSGSMTVSSADSDVNLTASSGEVVVAGGVNTFTFNETAVSSASSATYNAVGTATFTSSGGDTTISTTGSSSNVNLVSDDTGLVSMTQGTTEMFNFELDTVTFKNTGDDNTRDYSLVAPTGSTENLTITLPPTAGTVGYVLRTDGAGVTTWVDPGAALTLPENQFFVGDAAGDPVATGDRYIFDTLATTTEFNFNVGADSVTTVPTFNFGTGSSVTSTQANIGLAGTSTTLEIGSGTTADINITNNGTNGSITNNSAGTFIVDNTGGSSTFTSSGGNTVVSSTDTAGTVTMSAPASGSVITSVNGSTAMEVVTAEDSTSTTSGTVRITGGLGVTQNAFALTWNAVSDADYKCNIRKVENSLAKINKLEGYTYDWKEEFVKNGTRQYGVIAQQVEEAGLSELIASGGEHKAVNYNGFIPILIEAIKELSARVEYFETKDKTGLGMEDIVKAFRR